MATPNTFAVGRVVVCPDRDYWRVVHKIDAEDAWAIALDANPKAEVCSYKGGVTVEKICAGESPDTEWHDTAIVTGMDDNWVYALWKYHSTFWSIVYRR
jgi:hypothetical protein